MDLIVAITVISIYRPMTIVQLLSQAYPSAVCSVNINHIFLTSALSYVEALNQPSFLSVLYSAHCHRIRTESDA